MKINVGVMFGGESVEHEVSIISALQAIEAIDKDKYNVVPIYISKNRQLYHSDLLLDISNYQDLDKLISESNQIYLTLDDSQVYLKLVKPKLFSNKSLTIDVIVPIMHGTNGEDGVLQGYLEMLKIPYSGSDTVASAVGQDKVIMKHIFENTNLPIVDWFYMYSFDFEENQEKYIAKANEIGYPVVIKPANLGSSIGISIVFDDKQFIEGITLASSFDEKIVVEKGVEALKEINCSILGNSQHYEVSVIEEVIKADEILSFEDKYIGSNKTKGSSKSMGMAQADRKIPADISEELKEEVYNLSRKVGKVLNASGVCRIDFMLDEKTNKVYVNEINSMPGSLAFYLWDKKDVNFTQLMDRLIELAIDRQRRKERLTFSYESNILSNFSANSSKSAKLKV